MDRALSSVLSPLTTVFHLKFMTTLKGEVIIPVLQLRKQAYSSSLYSLD